MGPEEAVIHIGRSWRRSLSEGLSTARAQAMERPRGAVVRALAKCQRRRMVRPMATWVVWKHMTQLEKHLFSSSGPAAFLGELGVLDAVLGISAEAGLVRSSFAKGSNTELLWEATPRGVDWVIHRQVIQQGYDAERLAEWHAAWIARGGPQAQRAGPREPPEGVPPLRYTDACRAPSNLTTSASTWATAGISGDEAREFPSAASDTEPAVRRYMVHSEEVENVGTVSLVTTRLDFLHFLRGASNKRTPAQMRAEYFYSLRRQALKVMLMWGCTHVEATRRLTAMGFPATRGIVAADAHMLRHENPGLIPSYRSGGPRSRPIDVQALAKDGDV